MISKFKELLFNQAPGTYAGVIVVGLFGSIVYDSLVRPGLSEFGRLTLNVITFGSNRINDYAYESASVDPTPLTSLFILLIIIALVILAAISGEIKRSVGKKTDEEHLKMELIAEEKSKTEIEKIEIMINEIDQKLKRLQVKLYSLLLASTLITFFGFSFHNQTIVIWRSFHSNLMTISPFLSDYDRKIIESQFSQVETKNDYIIIRKKLENIAIKNNVKLKSIELW